VSWWDVPGGGVIGDGPADVMTLALENLARERDESGKPRPSLASVLGGLAAVLASDGERPPRIVASRADGDEIESAAPDVDVEAAFREAEQEIARQYEERWGRRPDPRELLRTLRFVLMAPEAYLSGGEGLELTGVELAG
jgi:hypothetical protein